ncbi:MAG: hypothetical protein GY786_07120 [Proteobacteria bacterium]|nr:hypothetical protein [Pseudomonadota bacterium]
MSSNRSRHFVILLSAFLLISGCQSNQSKPAVDSSQLQLINAYQLDRIDLDYLARCKIQIKSDLINQSSSCNIAITTSGEMKLTLHHPLAGEILVSYMNTQQIQILNRDDKVFFDLTNTEKSRSRFPEIPNFTVPELFQVMWGRELNQLDSQLVFSFDDQARPMSVAKKDGKNDLLVHYKKWKQFNNISIPRLLTVNDKRNKTRIKIAIIEFTPGRAVDLKFVQIPEDYKIEY